MALIVSTGSLINSARGNVYVNHGVVIRLHRRQFTANEFFAGRSDVEQLHLRQNIIARRSVSLLRTLRRNLR